MKPSSVLVLVQACCWAFIFTQCSTPRSISRSDYQHKKTKPIPVEEHTSENDLKSGSYSSPASGNGSDVAIYSSSALTDEVLLASASKKIFFLPQRVQAKNEISMTAKKIKQAGNDQDKKTKTGDKKKNGFATIGFLSIVAGLCLGITIPLTVATSWPLIFVPIGMVFCTIGLKSQRKGWAKAGLIIGYAAVLFAIIAALMVSSFKLH